MKYSSNVVNIDDTETVSSLLSRLLDIEKDIDNVVIIYSSKKDNKARTCWTNIKHGDLVWLMYILKLDIDEHIKACYEV